MPEFVGSHRDWNVYKFQDGEADHLLHGERAQEAGGQLHAARQPGGAGDPAAGPRAVYEVSVQPGYTYLDGSEVEIQVDRRKFVLFTRGEHAWTPREKDDRDLINAMKRGVDMTVRGTSTKNTYSLDTYSLLGFTAAYDAMVEACAGSTS